MDIYNKTAFEAIDALIEDDSQVVIEWLNPKQTILRTTNPSAIGRIQMHSPDQKFRIVGEV